MLPESYLHVTDNSQLLNFKIPYLYHDLYSCAHKLLLHSRVVPRRGSTEKTIYMYSHLIMQVTSKDQKGLNHPVHAMHTLTELETVE